MSAPQPDEYGRFRVQTDTGAQVSVCRPPLPHERVLDEPASDVGGEALPTAYPEPAAPSRPAPSSLSSSTPSGQKADPEKEKS